MTEEKTIFGFAFRGNISSVVLFDLAYVDHQDIIGDPGSIETYLGFLLNHQPAYILGLGSYSGRDQDKIRIEQICTNKFRNSFIEGNSLEILPINPYLRPDPMSKFTSAIGNSYCNFVSYRIMKLIETGQLQSQYTFLHIPKPFDSSLATKNIDEMILNYRKIFRSI